MGVRDFNDNFKKIQLLSYEDDHMRAIDLLCIKWIDEPILWDQFTKEHCADHKKNWASALLDPLGISRSDNGLERHMRTIKKEVTK